MERNVSAVLGAGARLHKIKDRWVVRKWRQSVLLFPVKEGIGDNGNLAVGQAWSQGPCPEEEMEMGVGLDLDWRGLACSAYTTSCLLLEAPGLDQVRHCLCKASMALPYCRGSQPPLSSCHYPGSVCRVTSAQGIMMQ